MSPSRAPYSEYVELSFEDGPCCPACRGGFSSGDNLVVCPACRALAHQECLGKVGTCTTFGCSYGIPVPPLPRRRRTRRLALFGAALLLSGGAALLLIPEPSVPGCRLPMEPDPIVHVPNCEQPVAPILYAGSPKSPNPWLEAVSPRLELRVPTTVQAGEVLIRGQITGSGPLRVDVSAPSGNVGWDAFEPGPFVTGVTLLTAGRHEITVSVTDSAGRVTATTYVVNRAG